MMKKILFFFLGLGFILSSCSGPEVTFTEPQPTDVDVTEKFKRKFRGEYLCLSDSSVLKVDKTRITQYWYFLVNVDSNSNIEKPGPKINISGDDVNFKAKISDDSTKYEVDYQHDLFLSSATELAKYVGGVYFLNFKEGPNSWSVKTMSFDKDGYLVIVDLHLSESDIEVLKEITEVSQDQSEDNEYVDYSLKPTRKELEQLMNADLFETGEKFVRMK